MTPLRLTFMSFTLPDGFYYFQVVERKSITNTLNPATSCVERARLVASLGSQRDLKS